MIATNRDLTLAVTALVARHETGGRPLEAYLRALRRALAVHRDAPDLSPDDLLAALDRGFTDPVPDDPPPPDLTVDDDVPATAEVVDRMLASQVLDLVDAAAAGMLDDPYRHGGLVVERSPGPERGTWSLWFNWEPGPYLTCGAAGTFGGWQDGDPGDRVVVPGDVAVRDEDGSVTAVPAADVVEPIVPLARLTWDQVASFVHDGQTYE